MKRKGMRGLVTVVLITILAMGLTYTKEWKPLLGLDLQGGVMVVLGPEGNPGADKIETAMQIMEQRINALGVAEPDIRLEGGKIVVQIAGIKDKERAIKLVGETAQMRFRPVLADLPPDAPEVTTPGSTPGSTPPGSTPGTEVPGSTPPGSLVPGAEATTVPPTTPTTTPVVTVPASSQPQAMGGVGELAQGEQPPTTVGDVTPGPSVSVPVSAPGAPTVSDPVPPTMPSLPTPGLSTPDPSGQQSLTPEQMQSLQAQAGAQGGGGVTTKPEDDVADQVVILPVYDETGTTQVRRVQLGPAQLTGEALEDASAALGQNGQWLVRPRFKPGVDGIDKFNAISSKCFAGAPECPKLQGSKNGRLAITLDGRVITDPSINTASFDADQIEISGSFTETSAREVATKLRYGALPVVLRQEQVTEVSASLGKDALNAGIVAGSVGLGLVVLYMVAFYRFLGVLAMAKLLMEAALLWSIISFLGDNAGLALTLAGLTGIIVSVGVSLDSNVVFYEHLKEDIRNGRTYRSAVDKSFEGAFRTIVKADGVSVLGAALLYFLSVGPVRGFALYLGLSTVLDLITSYYFMRPLVGTAVRSDFAVEHPGVMGLPRPEEVERSTLAKVARRARARSGPSVTANDGEAPPGGVDAQEVAP